MAGFVLPIVVFATPPKGRIDLELIGPGEVAAGSLAATVLVRPVGRVVSQRDAELPEPRHFTMEWPGARRLELEGGIVWELRVEAEGYWDRPFTVTSAPGFVYHEQRRLVPTGTLRGTFAPGTEKTPGSLQLRVRGETRPETDVRDWDQARCEVREERFVCRPPVGRHDLRLSADGAVPHYLWDTEVPPDRPVELGAVRFEAGASVSGWVRLAGRQGAATPRSSHTDVAARLVPLLTGDGSVTAEERIAATALETTVDEKGFFQLRGAPQGTFRLVLSAPGYAPARVEPVHLVQGRESVLDEEVVLRPPVTVRLRIDPPLDPFGRPWRWELLRTDSPPGRLHSAGTGQLDDGGEAVVRDLVPGPHLLTLADADGSGWYGEEVVIGDGRDTLSVELDVVSMDGRVLLGEEPLAATVVFGSAFAPTSLRFESDEEGRFAGHLPRSGEWSVQVRDGRSRALMTAEPVQVEPEGGLAEVVVRLPDTRVAGTVVDEDGDPVPGAALIAVLPEERRWGSQAQSGETGAFALRGLAPGDYFLQARRASAASPWTPISVVEERPVRDLVLMLRESRIVTGRLTSGGVPVPGASVQAVPQRHGEAPHGVDHGISDVDGVFRVEVPAGSTLVDLLISAHGLPLVVRRLPLGEAAPRLDLDVERVAGSLELLGFEHRPGEPTPAVLFVRGVPVHLSQVRSRWQRDDGSDVLRLVDMEPGPYALCAVESLIAAGGIGSGAGCPAGYLSPLGTLRLDLGPTDPDTPPQETVQ